MDNTLFSRLTVSRRAALLGLAGTVALGRARMALAATTPGDNRFIVVLLRGAMDGMSAVEPYGDRNFADLRGDLALPADQRLDLGGFWGLHPKFAALHGMFGAGEAAFVHAAAGSYRTRSHFEAQDYLEAGVEQRINNGWLNRAASLLAANPQQELALSLGISAPLLLRGPAAVRAWAPEKFATPDPTLLAQIAALAAHDPVLGPGFAGVIDSRNRTAETGGMDMPPDQPGAGKPAAHDFAQLAHAAGKILSEADGPRIAALELGGWDTHQAQIRRLENQFAILDAGLAELKASLGVNWRSTAVLVVTEFGRTARHNGTAGTDHGTASVAILAGGAIAGGKVLGDWPGLASNQLFEGRDLAPTTDLRALAKALLTDHMGLAEARLETVFPGSANVAPARGLLRT